MQIPLSKDVAKLPRWARVAFAAGCARRVQPLFKAHLPSATARQIATIERAISLAEEVARQAPAWASDAVVIRLHAAFQAADKLARSLRRQNPGAGAIALAAAKTAEAAEYACCQGRTKDATAAAQAAKAACEADPSESLRTEICKSWNDLHAAAQAEKWTKETPIPARFFIARGTP
jgi:hypothetical protein